MKKLVVITVILGVVGYLIYQAVTPDFVKVNRQMVEACKVDDICD